MNSRHVAIVISFVLALLVSVRASAQPKAPTAPKKSGPIDDTLYRLLEDERVCKELRLEDVQSWTLDLMHRAYMDRRKALGHKVAFAKGVEKQKLEREAAENKQSFYRDVGKLLSEAQLLRVAQIRLQAIGPRAAFLPDLAAKLKISAEQNGKFVEALIKYEDAIYGEFRNLPFDAAEEVVRDRLLTIHQAERKKLGRVIEDSILQKAQFERLALEMGTPIDFEADLVKAETLLTEVRQRAQRMVPRFREPYPLDAFIRQPELRRLLETTEIEDHRLTRCADAWEKKEDDFYASVQYLNPRLWGAKLGAWQKSYTDGVPKLEGEVREILGTQRFERLKEIRRQVCGPEILLQLEPMKGHELTAAQRHKIEKTRTEMFAELQREVTKNVEQETFGNLPALHAAFAKTTAQLVLDNLTTAQREAWQKLIGAPINENVRQSIRKATVDFVHQYPARRG